MPSDAMDKGAVSAYLNWAAGNFDPQKALKDPRN
jgi:hypothetical protein